MSTQLHAVEGPPLTRPDIVAILEEWQHRLHLDHWKIDVAWDRPLDDEEADGEVQYSEHVDAATIRIAKGWAKWTRGQAHAVLAHELVHVVCRDMDELVKAAKLAMPEQTYALFSDRYDHENEGVVDRLATALVAVAGVA